MLVAASPIVADLRRRSASPICVADDLVLLAESVEELTRKFSLWKQGLEGKGFRVNLGKTKVMEVAPVWKTPMWHLLQGNWF